MSGNCLELLRPREYGDPAAAAGTQSQWNMALDHAQHGAADLRASVTGKSGVSYQVAVSELETAARYVARLISRVPRNR
jgi:hypothetical protein